MEKIFYKNESGKQMENEGRYIGLKRGIVSLESYDDRWKVMAEKMIALLKNILGSDVIDIQHVGSTAIKGIKARTMEYISSIGLRIIGYWKGELVDES